MSQTHRNPRTGTVWQFPEASRRYEALIDRMTSYEYYECEYSHCDCAAWLLGPCGNEWQTGRHFEEVE